MEFTDYFIWLSPYQHYTHILTCLFTYCLWYVSCYLLISWCHKKPGVYQGPVKSVSCAFSADEMCEDYYFPFVQPWLWL